MKVENNFRTIRKFTVALLYLTPWVLGAQNIEKKKWELSVNLLNLSENLYYANDITLAPGFMIKHNHKKINYRFGVERYSAYMGENIRPGAAFYHRGHYHKGMMRLGVEKEFVSVKRFELKGFFDFGRSISTRLERSNGDIAFTRSEFYEKKKEWLLMPGVGLSYRISNATSISLETRITFSKRKYRLITANDFGTNDYLNEDHIAYYKPLSAVNFNVKF